MDPSLWGKEAWHFLHAVTLAYPDQPTKFQQDKMYEFFMNLQYILPCQTCQNNYKIHLEQYPLRSFLNSKESLVNWLFMIHNITNASLGKQPFTLDQLYKKYTLKRKFTIRKSTVILFFLLILSIIIYFNFKAIKKGMKRLYYKYLY